MHCQPRRSLAAVAAQPRPVGAFQCHAGAIWLLDVVPVSPHRIVSGERGRAIEAIGWGRRLAGSAGSMLTLLALSLQPSHQGYQVALVGVSLVPVCFCPSVYNGGQP